MFENEGTEIEQQTQSDAAPETPSESPIENQPAQQEAAPQAQKEVPFHEHPRWKEVMEERNAERQRSQTLEQQIAAMQRQLQESMKPKSTQPDFNELRSKMAKRFEGIDPETHAYFNSLEEQALSAREELRQFREEQFVNRALSRIQELNKENSVSPEIASLYEAQLDKAYREGKIRSIEDLDKNYKATHEPFAKMLESRERDLLAKYTTAKKQDAKTPTSQPKGKAPMQNGKIEFSKNPQEAKAQLIKHVANSLKASREV